MWLAIDSGNSRVKWAELNKQGITTRGDAVKSDLTALAAAANVADEIWVSHVGNDDDLRRLQRVLPRRGARFLRSNGDGGGVQNRYQPPTALGCDRWLCLLAARRWRRDVIVVSAGTAVTVDLLSAGGIFRGGLILPGNNLMLSSLAAVTTLPSIHSGHVSAALPPGDTKTAMATGAALAAAGAVMQFRRRVAAGAAIAVTGGDAALLLPWLPAARHTPDLVFHGMIALRQSEKQ